MANANDMAQMREFVTIIDGARAQSSSSTPKLVLSRLASPQLANLKALPVDAQRQAFMNAEQDYEEAKRGIERLLQKTREPQMRETLEKAREGLVGLWEGKMTGQEMAMREAVARVREQRRE